eukprot:TRINITY_DN213_c0_g1_i1.p1 TRINITY_DN213_c0_g1~~TRINITY_DN213_c0_g1_i1.p1  ORF type:complete len:535 (+),score=79.29 TRINITY_DN213_c0_g1_i1:187-1791(+)
MELGVPETLYAPLINEGESDTSSGVPVVDDPHLEGGGEPGVFENEPEPAVSEYDRRVVEDKLEVKAEEASQKGDVEKPSGPKVHSTFEHVFYDDNNKINKLPFIRKLFLKFNIFHAWILFATFYNIILLALYISSRATGIKYVELASFAVGNLMITCLLRNEFFVHLIYYCSVVPRSLRLYLHRAVIEIGGLHVGAAVWGTIWTTIYVGDDLGQVVEEHPEVFITGVVLIFFLCGMILTALPWARNRYHNIWEIVHRIFGWSVIIVLTLHIILYTTLYWDGDDSDNERAAKTFSSAPFWMTMIAGASVFYVWFVVQIVVKPYAYVPNNNGTVCAIRFPNGFLGLASPGTYARISTNYVEWHSFSVAVKSPDNTFQVVMAAAGDWTRNMIKKVSTGHPPPVMFLRRVKPPGFMYCIHSYKKVVAVATGAGIAPVLPHLIMKTANIHVVWVAREHRRCYGDQICDIVFSNPSKTIFDTATDGKPDAIGLALRAFDETDADAIFIVSNPFLTFALQRACKDRPAGHRIPCYGATWDS